MTSGEGEKFVQEAPASFLVNQMMAEDPDRFGASGEPPFKLPAKLGE